MIHPFTEQSRSKLPLFSRPDIHQNTSSFPVANDKQSSENQENKEAAAATKTVAEFDEELRLKLEGRSGEGGEAGLELEDGKPAAMKRGVKNNMFRLI